MQRGLANLILVLGLGEVGEIVVSKGDIPGVRLGKAISSRGWFRSFRITVGKNLTEHILWSLISQCIFTKVLAIFKMGLNSTTLRYQMYIIENDGMYQC